MASLYRKPIVVRDPDTGEKVKAKSKKWWGRYADALGQEKRVPLSVEKRAAQTMLNDLVAKVERQRAGLDDPIDEEMQRPISTHLATSRRANGARTTRPSTCSRSRARSNAASTRVDGGTWPRSRPRTCRASWPTFGRTA